MLSNLFLRRKPRPIYMHLNTWITSMYPLYMIHSSWTIMCISSANDFFPSHALTWVDKGAHLEPLCPRSGGHLPSPIPCSSWPAGPICHTVCTTVRPCIQTQNRLRVLRKFECWSFFEFAFGFRSVSRVILTKWPDFRSNNNPCCSPVAPNSDRN